MNVAAISQLSPSLAPLSFVLQGAVVGALTGSLVLCRARLRRLRVEPWAVTAAWSAFGALVALLYLSATLAF